MQLLKGKKVFVLGGSSGIGKCIIEGLESEGAEVFSSYNASSVNTKKENSIQIDLNSQASIKASENFFEEHTFSGFINCAGVNIAGPLIGLDVEDIRKQVDVNLTGPMIITQMIIKNMIRARSGNIIHLGSVSAHRFFRGHSIYSATKAGLEGFVQAMASEVAKRGIRVNAILPGPVMTPMLEKSMNESGVDPKENIPTNKLIEASEIANMCNFILSEKCPSLTGALIPIDGGYLLW